MPRETPETIILNSANPSEGLSAYSSFCKSFSLKYGRPPLFNKNNSQILRLFGNSFLADKLCLNPDWQIEYESSHFFSKPKTKSLIREELRGALAKCDSQATAPIVLRRYKYSQLARIAAKEFSGEHDEKEILAEYSDVAVISAAYDISVNSAEERLGPPLLGEKRSSGCVIGLGKLGSRELNISSDVDVIFIYDSDFAVCKMDGVESSANEFYSLVARLFTKLMSEVTPDGFVFRVDHDLRPEGRSGALANSKDALEYYYQYFGSQWERQMLIRARPVAGDEGLGEDLIRSLSPFVYPRSVTWSSLSHLREMKAKIERETASSSLHLNIKLGPGGIRELEFFVQALTQLFGGIHPELRVQNTFTAISMLTKKNLLHPSTAKRLSLAYSFLRRAENCIQLASDLQTHILPETPEGMLSLSKRFGARESAGPFQSQLLSHVKFVQSAFNSLFAKDYEKEELLEAAAYNLSLCTTDEEKSDALAWFKATEHKRLKEILAQKNLPLPRLMGKITLLADVTVETALKIVTDSLTPLFGTPMLEDGRKCGFCIAAMGRFGSREMDFHSDLDVIFLHEGDGMTNGKRRVANAEYFTRLAQRLISLISLPTRYGRAYSIDSELRPSGRAGALITSLPAFIAYHENEAMLWERLSLLRLRPTAGDDDFMNKCANEHARIAYERLPQDPANACAEILQLRKKVMAERRERDEHKIPLRWCDGGLYDLETAVQIFQLFSANLCESVRVTNTFDAIEALYSEGLIDETDYEKMLSALTFLRLLMMQSRLDCGRATEDLRLNLFDEPDFASRLGFVSAKELIEKHESVSKDVKDLLILALNFAAGEKKIPAKAGID